MVIYISRCTVREVGLRVRDEDKNSKMAFFCSHLTQ